MRHRHPFFLWILATLTVAGGLGASEPAPPLKKPVPHVVAAALLAGGGQLPSPRRQEIPPGGLEPAGISWDLDRDSVRRKDSSTYLASDRFQRAFE